LVAIEDAVVNAGLVFFGFLIAVGWDRIQRKRADNEGRDRILNLIKIETANNAVTCQQVATANLQGVTTIPHLRDVGWDTAVSNWPLLKLSPDETVALSNTYRSVSSVNEAIRIRDTYAITMVAMSNYAQVLAALNTMLTNTIQLFVRCALEMQPFIDARLKKVGRLEKLRRVRLRRS